MPEDDERIGRAARIERGVFAAARRGVMDEQGDRGIAAGEPLHRDAAEAREVGPVEFGETLRGQCGSEDERVQEKTGSGHGEIAVVAASQPSRRDSVAERKAKMRRRSGRTSQRWIQGSNGPPAMA